MVSNRGRKAGRHFLQIPGPTPVPDRILRAMDMPTIDHRGPEFKDLGLRCLEGMKRIFKTKDHVVIYPSSGTGAWEAALTNVLSPGDRILMYETGQFAVLWKGIAERFGLKVDFIASDWRSARRPEGNRRAAQCRQGARDQSGLRRAQRDLDRRATTSARRARRHRRRASPGAAARRYDFGARLDRLPAR